MLSGGSRRCERAWPAWHPIIAAQAAELAAERQAREAELVTARAGLVSRCWRGRLAAGEPVCLPDGRTVRPDEVRGPARPGCRVAVIGDTESVEDLMPHVRGADLLIVEGTFLDRDADAARERSHLTVADAARLAREAGVSRLWLTHQSPRYRADEVERAAASCFPGARIARDFDRVRVPDPSGPVSDRIDA